jgi:protein SCO1/2
MTAIHKLIITGVIACAAGGAALFVLRERPPQNTLESVLAPKISAAEAAKGEPPVMFAAPKFDFVNQDGKQTANKQLQGRIWIADFIFTHCAGSCPLVTAKLVQVQKDLNDPELRFVSFSVDPERDDPTTLKDYGEKNHSGDSRWLLLRPPDRKAVMLVAQKMAAITHSVDAHDSILHTDFFVLIDQTGKVRGLYDSKQDHEIERLKSDIRVLSKKT